jgi:hypothetical protein
MGRGIVGTIMFAYRDWIASSSVRLLVDDVEVGQLNQDEQLKVQVEPGLQRIRLECPIKIGLAEHRGLIALDLDLVDEDIFGPTNWPHRIAGHRSSDRCPNTSRQVHC